MKDGTKNLNSSELYRMEITPSEYAMRVGKRKPYYIIAKEKENAKKKDNQKEMDSGRG